LNNQREENAMAKPECQPIRDAITACTNAIPLLKASEAKCEKGQRLEALRDAQAAMAMVNCAAMAVDAAFADATMDWLQSAGLAPMPMDLDLDMGEPK
jgi:hypothetical protein